MPVFKNESNGTWYVMARYVNWKGERKQKCKRGFSTKKEAQEWERMFQLQNSSDMDMSFEAFTELYIRDMKSRLKENTWLTKEHIIRTKILPYFGKLKISEISTKEVIEWQNEMLAYRDEKKKPYSQTYQQDQKLYLIRNTETLLWDLQKAETELWKEPPEPLLDEIAELVMKDNPYWEGSPTALVALINVDIQPHVITRKLNVLAGRLYAEHGILFRSERVHEGRKLRLWKDNTENE